MAQKAWVVRPYPHGKLRLQEFLTQGIVAIGWPKTGDLAGKSKSQIKEVLKEHYPAEGYSLGQSAGIVDRFVNSLVDGDLVLVPISGAVLIGRVCAGGYKYNAAKATENEGYPHQQRIDWLNDKQAIPKKLMTGRFVCSLRGRQSVFGVDFDEATALLSKKDGSSATNVPSREFQEDYLKRLQGRQIPGIDDNGMELLVLEVLKLYYPDLARQPKNAGKEGGDTDLKTMLPGDLVVRVQVKHFDPSKPLGPKVVEQLANDMDEGDWGIVATSGVISDDAKIQADEYCRQNKKITFIDGQQLVDLIFDNLDEFNNEQLQRFGLLRKLEVRKI